MARGKDDETSPQSDRDRRVLKKDQAPLSSEVREPGPDHRARSERETGGAAWEAAAEKALHDRVKREQTGRDAAGQDQRGRPDAERDQQQVAKEQHEAQQRDERAREDELTREQQEQRHLDRGQDPQVRAQEARARQDRALGRRDQSYADADIGRQSARDDAELAHDLREDDPESDRAQSLEADHDRKRSVALGDERAGHRAQADADREAAVARGDETRAQPKPEPKQDRGAESTSSDAALSDVRRMRKPRRGTKARRSRAGKDLGRPRDRGRERRA